MRQVVRRTCRQQTGMVWCLVHNNIAIAAAPVADGWGNITLCVFHTRCDPPHCAETPGVFQFEQPPDPDPALGHSPWRIQHRQLEDRLVPIRRRLPRWLPQRAALQNTSHQLLPAATAGGRGGQLQDCVIIIHFPRSSSGVGHLEHPLTHHWR